MSLIDDPTVEADLKLDLLRFVPFRLNRLAAEVSRGLERVYAERFGIDVIEWRVLATLGMHEPRSARFIVGSTRTHKSRISRAVARLIRAGLIEGVASDGDRRELPLRMTGEGRDLYRKLVPIVRDYERRLLARLRPDDLDGLARGLDRLEEAMGLSRHEEGG